MIMHSANLPAVCSNHMRKMSLVIQPSFHNFHNGIQSDECNSISFEVVGSIVSFVNSKAYVLNIMRTDDTHMSQTSEGIAH
jgi:hypothetical protein